MAKGQTQSIDDRVADLIKEATGKIAGENKAGNRDGAGSPSTCGVEQGTRTQRDGLARKRPGPGLDDPDDAADHAGIDIYGAHPRDD